MWPDLWKGALTRFSKCAYFKEAYFRNAMRYLNQTWVFYGEGVAAAITQKWSLSTAPSGCYGAEFTALAIEVSFSKNGTTTKARIFGMEGALDFYRGIALVEGYCLYCTKDYIVAINSCGNMTVWKSSKIENSRKMRVKVPFLRSGHKCEHRN